MLLRNPQKGDNSAIDKEYVKNILSIIAQEFDPEKYKIYKPGSIRESRLITASKVIEKHQSSCGARATVVASILRKLNIPTKIIHGRYIENNPEMRHAWNEVLLDNGKWVAFDIMEKKQGISKFHTKEF